jgi:stringent starvation protein B
MSDPISTKPYLMRAIYEWCVDNGYTPYVSVMVDANTRVPMEYVRDGEIVLNVGPLATNRLHIGNDMVECTARFSGVARELLIPVCTVSAIYARENGQGMSFEAQASVVSDSAASATSSSPASSPAVGAAVNPGASPGPSPVAGVAPGASGAPASSVVALDPAATGKPSLRIVK